MFSDIIEIFKHMKLRTSMYVHPVNYDTVVSYIAGYNCAMRGCLLEGFYEWLAMKYGSESACGWPYLTVMILEREISGTDSPDVVVDRIANDKLFERMAIDKLFDLLEEFLLIKQDRNRRGLRWIYAQFEQCEIKHKRRLDKMSEQEQQPGM